MKSSRLEFLVPREEKFVCLSNSIELIVYIEEYETLERDIIADRVFLLSALLLHLL